MAYPLAVHKRGFRAEDTIFHYNTRFLSPKSTRPPLIFCYLKSAGITISALPRTLGISHARQRKNPA